MEDKNQKKHFKASFMGYIHSAVGYKRIFNNKMLLLCSLVYHKLPNWFSTESNFAQKHPHTTHSFSAMVQTKQMKDCCREHVLPLQENHTRTQ